MKLNKYLFIFSSLFVFLLMSYLIILFKFFPVLFHHTIYFCQEMIKALSLGLPGDFGNFVFVILSLSLTYATIRLLASILRIFSFRKSLTKIIIENKTISSITQKPDLENKVVLLRSDKPFAFCFGIRNPKIYISTKLLTITSPGELESIIQHEKYHLENKDTLIMLLANLLKSMFIFFPVFSDLIRIYKQDRELKADKYAIRQYNGKKSLSSVLQKLLRYDFVTLPLTPNMADADTLETRIKSLLNQDIPRKKIAVKNILISFVSLIVLLELTVTPVKGVNQINENHHEKITCSELSFTPAYFSPVN